MTYTIHMLHNLSTSQVRRLADIHMGDHGLLSELGYPFVHRYFEIVNMDEKVIGVYALDDQSGEIIGYNIAAPTPSALTSQLIEDRRWFVREILKVLITRPAALLQLAVSSLTIQHQMEDQSDAIESLYLTIDDKYRGQKVGRTLQKALLEEAHKAGYNRVVGSIEISNTPSIKMCLSNGFVVKKTIREGKYTRHRIEKIL